MWSGSTVWGLTVMLRLWRNGTARLLNKPPSDTARVRTRVSFSRTQTLLVSPPRPHEKLNGNICWIISNSSTYIQIALKFRALVQCVFALALRHLLPPDTPRYEICKTMLVWERQRNHHRIRRTAMYPNVAYLTVLVTKRSVVVLLDASQNAEWREVSGMMTGSCTKLPLISAI